MFPHFIRLDKSDRNIFLLDELGGFIVDNDGGVGLEFGGGDHSDHDVGEPFGFEDIEGIDVVVDGEVVAAAGLGHVEPGEWLVDECQPDPLVLEYFGVVVEEDLDIGGVHHGALDLVGFRERGDQIEVLH